MENEQGTPNTEFRVGLTPRLGGMTREEMRVFGNEGYQSGAQAVLKLREGIGHVASEEVRNDEASDPAAGPTA